MKTTNYYNTFIEVADDCPVKTAEVPPIRGEKTIANIEFELLVDNPYEFTSDDVLFHVHAAKRQLRTQEFDVEREQFFSKGQACFRSSPLTKRYGWGAHFDADGRMAIYAVESDEYQQYAKDRSLKQVKAMRSKKG
ncbi:DUF6157 family protein [Chitinophaga pinensis]|uniref:Uncharacterized protein n=1 Tax=Chitinophaga pinensis (strain ATCC 43595 / DSM 2588 / LMG 13176 / NBRC 15968 / NCIMB 11800 / UQM 2034) TaxID=485918 RepID=A0A979GB40_CHIPD|nr:DUF6157 family protein [Chitinophaga pinensis]ACU64155.1 conserved hypothetical protein [Chitinophaga pinensis DSM 2588]